MAKALPLPTTFAPIASALALLMKGIMFAVKMLSQATQYTPLNLLHTMLMPAPEPQITMALSPLPC